jgi:hypothetical protein
MTADPMVPDEALTRAAHAYQVIAPCNVYALTAALAAAMPALTAAARAEVAASVYALAETDYKGRPFVWLHEVREAVSDSGVTAHNQQMRAEERERLIADAERCQELLTKPNGEMTPEDWNELREHPLRFSGRELLKWIDWLRAEAAGDQHHQGGDE